MKYSALLTLCALPLCFGGSACKSSHARAAESVLADHNVGVQSLNNMIRHQTEVLTQFIEVYQRKILEKGQPLIEDLTNQLEVTVESSGTPNLNDSVAIRLVEDLTVLMKALGSLNRAVHQFEILKYLNFGDGFEDYAHSTIGAKGVRVTRFSLNANIERLQERIRKNVAVSERFAEVEDAAVKSANLAQDALKFLDRELDMAHGRVVDGQPLDLPLPRLLYAIAVNDHSQIHELLNSGLDVNAADEFGRTPLMFAARYSKRPDLLKLLLSLNADVNAENIFGHTALMVAAGHSQNPENIKLLLESGANVHVEEGGWTPLMLALKAGNHYEIIRLLLEYGAEVNTKTNLQGMRPWFFEFGMYSTNPYVLASLGQIRDGEKPGGWHGHFLGLEGPAIWHRAFGNPGNTYSILHHGHAPYKKMVSGVATSSPFLLSFEWHPVGSTPLMVAAQHWPTLEVIQLLLHEGAEVNARTERSLHDIRISRDETQNDFSRPYHQWVFGGWSKNRLLFFHRQSPLGLAAAHTSNPNVIELLLEHGANVHVDALNLAVENTSSSAIVKLLLENGAKVNDAGSTGLTPLIFAARHSTHPEIIQVLLDHGAAVNAECLINRDSPVSGGWNWPSYMRAHNFRRTSPDIPLTPLASAAKWNPNVDVVHVLLENGALANKLDALERTGLMWAAKYSSSPGVIQALIDGGATLKPFGKHHSTPLLVAARYSLNPEIVQLLLENGASEYDKFEGTGPYPLTIAAAFSHSAAIVQLLANNEFILSRGDGRDSPTPLYAAISNSTPDIVQLLLDLDAPYWGPLDTPGNKYMSNPLGSYYWNKSLYATQAGFDLRERIRDL